MIINKPTHAFLGVVILLILCGCNINSANFSVTKVNRETTRKAQ